jgi:hypothetical protein
MTPPRRRETAPPAPPDDDLGEGGIDIPLPFGDALAAATEAERILQDTRPPIPWHLADLDRNLMGMRPGWLVTIGSRPANGKTTFLTNWLNRTYERTRYRVVYVATEMAPPTMYLKWAAHRTLIEEHLVMARDWPAIGAAGVKQLADEITALSSQAASERVWFPDLPSPRLSDLLDLIADTVAHHYDVLVLDHLHRVEPAPGQDERSAIQMLCRTLKNAAVRHKMLVLVAGHLRREDSIFDRYYPPHLGSWLGSSAIEGESDLSIGLYRPLRPMTATDERRIRTGEVPIGDFVMPDTMGVKCLKHRFRGDMIDRVALLYCKAGIVGNYTARQPSMGV